jgi:hypothetical protein
MPCWVSVTLDQLSGVHVPHEADLELLKGHANIQAAAGIEKSWINQALAGNTWVEGSNDPHEDDDADESNE